MHWCQARASGPLSAPSSHSAPPLPGLIPQVEPMVLNGVEGTLLTNHEDFQGAIIFFAQFVWSAAKTTYAEFNVQVAEKLGVGYTPLSAVCVGACK